MRFLDLYYFVKPAIPHSFRLTIRRLIASRQRLRSAGVWPINESAAHRPKWWCGWPEGKQFAFVLTHDVEGRKGLDRCPLLAQLEMDLGFRSSFNFVPEGEYATPSTLREFLVKNGFEVGVHDLHHNGTLYRSRDEFSNGASRINEHLKEWQAVGFRSAFMFHNLEWLKELNVLYDASTFDTDPSSRSPTEPIRFSPSGSKDRMVAATLNSRIRWHRTPHCSSFSVKRRTISGNGNWTGWHNMAAWRWLMCILITLPLRTRLVAQSSPWPYTESFWPTSLRDSEMSPGVLCRGKWRNLRATRCSQPRVPGCR